MMPGALNKLVAIRHKLNRLRRDTGWHLGLSESRLKNAKGARILVYHGICPDDHLRFNTLFIKLKTFETQLRLYKKYFNIVSLDDFYHQRFNNEKFTICLTFDDGFANNYKYVLPLIEQYQVPATFFITGIREAGYDILWNDTLSIAYKYGPSTFTFRNEKFVLGTHGKYISSSSGKALADILRSGGFENKAEMIEILGSFKRRVENDYWLQMTKEQIKTLSGNRWVTIGSHSYYHNDLAKNSGDVVKDDLTWSKQYLENTTGKEIKALAFPYGSYTRETVQEAKNAGFTQLLATEFLFPEDANDAMLRERFTINPFISNVNQIHANIAGNYK